MPTYPDYYLGCPVYEVPTDGGRTYGRIDMPLERERILDMFEHLGVLQTVISTGGYCVVMRLNEKQKVECHFDNRYLELVDPRLVKIAKQYEGKHTVLLKRTVDYWEKTDGLQDPHTFNRPKTFVSRITRLDAYLTPLDKLLYRIDGWSLDYNGAGIPYVEKELNDFPITEKMSVLAQIYPDGVQRLQQMIALGCPFPMAPAVLTEKLQQSTGLELDLGPAPK